MLSLGSLLRRFLGAHTNMFITALAGFFEGARLYRFDMCVTSRYFVAEPWLATTCCGGGTRCGTESLELGDVAGFSITVPNCTKAVGVRSSMGTRMDGHGMEVGIVPCRQVTVQGCAGAETEGKDAMRGDSDRAGEDGARSGACDSISGGRNRRAKIAIAG